jgi:hypothetical protein
VNKGDLEFSLQIVHHLLHAGFSHMRHDVGPFIVSQKDACWHAGHHKMIKQRLLRVMHANGCHTKMFCAAHPFNGLHNFIVLIENKHQHQCVAVRASRQHLLQCAHFTLFHVSNFVAATGAAAADLFVLRRD